MATKKRKNGEGSWGKKKIKGIEYVTYEKTYDELDKRKTFYGKTAKEVKEKVAKFEAMNHLLPKKDIENQVFGDYIYTWLHGVKKGTVSDSTFDRAETTFNNLIKEYDVATCKMKNLTGTILQNHIKLLAKDYAKSTIDKVYFMFSQVISYAVKNKDISYNIMLDVKNASETEVANKKREVTFLTMEEVNKLFEECNRVNVKGHMVRGKEGERVYGNNAYAIILMVYTGIRVGELRALKWKSVDFEDKMIYISESVSTVKNRDNKSSKKTVDIVKKPKTEASIRPVPLADRAIYALKEMEKQNPNHKPDDFVFANTTGDGVSQSKIGRTLSNMLVRANLPKCTVHGLRHTYGSMLINEDEKNIAIVSSILGHEDIGVTYKIYTHILKKKKLDTIEILNKHHSNG